MQRVFTTLSRAKEALPEFVKATKQNCYVYSYRYGKQQTEEFVIKTEDEVLDKKSKQIRAMMEYTGRPVPKRKDKPALVIPPPVRTNYLFEHLMTMKP